MSVEFDAAKPDWLELWQGPLQFRATYDKGKYGPGSTLQRINQYGQEGATGGGRHVPIYSVKLAADDGAIVIEWLGNQSDVQLPLTTVRYYRAGLGRGLYERLSSDEGIRNSQLPFIAADQRQRAVGAFACGLTMRDWAEREFFHSLHAGQCEIWARVGNKVAPFRRIPPDVFAAYEIQGWGEGQQSGAWAKLDGAESLFAIKVATSSSNDNAAFTELLALLQSEAPQLWEKERDRVNSKFAKAGRVQSGYHIKTLTEAAEQVTSGLLDRAFALASPSADLQAVHGFAESVFEILVSEIVEIAVGNSGRMPQPDNDNVALRLADETKERLSRKIEFWQLQAKILPPSKPAAVAAPKAIMPIRAPAVKRGHPPADSDILAKADELKARGDTGYEIASKMRLEPGFENVATTAVRELIKGRWRGGRPSATAL